MHSLVKKLFLVIALGALMALLSNLMLLTQENVPHMRQTNNFADSEFTNRKYFCPQTGLDFIRAVGGTLHFANKAIVNHKDLRCQYFNEKWHELKPPQTLNLTLVEVKCFYKDIPIYNDYLPLLPEINLLSGKPHVHAPNILVFVIGSVSRTVFQKKMMKTRKVLKSIGALEFTGMNVLGPTTMENINSLLCGEIGTNCQPRQYIWNKFRMLGYFTGYAEDAYKDFTFKYIEDLGFHYQWNNTIEKYRGTNWAFENHPYCIKNKKNHDLLLKYTMQVYKEAKNKNRPLFFLGITNAARDSNDVLPFMDTDFANFLQDIYNLDQLSNTFIYFLSDHGFVRGNFQTATIQERMQPFAYLAVSQRFKLKSFYAYNSLVKNQKYLISHLDFYQSMRQLCAKAMANNFYLNLGIFSQFSANRTCEQAGVPIQYCAVIPKQKCTRCSVSLAAIAVVDYINNLLGYFGNCEKLTLKYVMDVRIDVENGLYVVDVRTTPGNGVFEGYVEKYPYKMQVLHVVALHNYFPKSRCETRREIRPFCTCSKRILDVIDNFVLIKS